MCPESGTTSRSIENVLPCDSVGSIELASDGYEFPAVFGKFHWKSKTLGCFCRNEPLPGTTEINQDSHHKGVAFTVLGEAHSGWVRVAVLGIGIDCEYFRLA